MHTKVLVLVCALILFGNLPIIEAQTTAISDTTSFHFWYSSFNARSVSLANATVADPHSASSMYSNPGLLAFKGNRPRLAVHSVYNTQKNVLVENLAVRTSNSSDKSLLLSATLINNGPDKLVQDTRQLSFTQLSLDIAYGQMLTSSLSLGFRMNTDYGVTQSSSSIAANTSMGLFYAPSSMISYGLVFKGTGYQNEWLGSGLSYFRTGQENTQLVTMKLPQRLELGTTLRFPSLAEHPDFVLSFSNEKLFGKSGLVYRGGAEVYLSDKVTLRGGYFHSSFVKGGRLGFGLLLDPLQINYGYRNNNLDLNGSAHIMSITVDI